MKTGLHKLVAPIILSVFATFSIQAQVTIGDKTKPVDGAILQLKENDQTGANSNKGLLLPRVQLTGHNLDAISKDALEADESYTGLTVWNIRGVGDICKGVNTWTGKKWELAMPRPKDHTGYNPTTGILTDHEGNSYTTASFGTAGIWMTQSMRSKSAPGTCEDTYFPNELTAEDFSKNMSINVVGYPNGDQPGETPPTTWDPRQGMLYTWALATNNKGGLDGLGNEDGLQDETNLEPVVRQGVCPNGWHIPSNSEWIELMKVLHADASLSIPLYANYSQANVGAKNGFTSAKSNTAITSILPKGASKSASQGGFDALLVGYITSKKNVTLFGESAYFWTSNSSNQGKDADGSVFASASHAYFSYKTENFNPSTPQSNYIGQSRRTAMYSVRCIKDK